MTKLQLPDVTLVMIETQEHALARLAVEDCLRVADFGDVLIFTDKPEHFPHLGRVLPAENWPNKLGWSRFSWYGVPPHVRLPQNLFIQWDSWIWQPEMWRDEFMDYDLIGAPWWYKDGKNVGNLGFALRSTRIIKYLYNNKDKYPCNSNTDDDLLCRGYRPQLEQHGFTWAPENVAHDFAFECSRPSPTSKHFGFHAPFNFHVVLDHERLLQRARLMQASPYISRGYLWENFAKANPQVLADLQEQVSA
jgi:hypothetical protein